MTTIAPLNSNQSSFSSCTPCSFFKNTQQKFSQIFERVQNKAESIRSDFRELDVLERISDRYPSTLVLITDLLAFHILKRQNSIICRALSLPFLVNASNVSLKELDKKEILALKNLSSNKKLFFSVLGNLGLVKIWSKSPLLAIISHLSLSVLWKLLEKKGGQKISEAASEAPLQNSVRLGSESTRVANELAAQNLESMKDKETSLANQTNLLPISQASLASSADQSYSQPLASDNSRAKPEEENQEGVLENGFGADLSRVDSEGFFVPSLDTSNPRDYLPLAPQGLSPLAEELQEEEQIHTHTPNAPRANSSMVPNGFSFPFLDAAPFTPKGQESDEVTSVVFGDSVENDPSSQSNKRLGGAAAGQAADPQGAAKAQSAKFKPKRWRKPKNGAANLLPA